MYPGVIVGRFGQMGLLGPPRLCLVAIRLLGSSRGADRPRG